MLSDSLKMSIKQTLIARRDALQAELKTVEQLIRAASHLTPIPHGVQFIVDHINNYNDIKSQLDEHFPGSFGSVYPNFKPVASVYLMFPTDMNPPTDKILHMISSIGNFCLAAFFDCNEPSAHVAVYYKVVSNTLYGRGLQSIRYTTQVYELGPTKTLKNAALFANAVANLLE